MTSVVVRFIGALLCGSLGALAFEPQRMFADPQYTCNCTVTGNTGIINDPCVGVSSNTTTCSVSGTTCSIAGTITWTPWPTTCAVPWGGSLPGTALVLWSPNNRIDADAASSGSWPITDTQNCPDTQSGNPGPSMFAQLLINYYSYGSGCSCGSSTAWLFDSKAWTCDWKHL